MSQIMTLLALAPDIVEELLFLPRTLSGRDAITEREVLRIASQADWSIQREAWRRLASAHLDRLTALVDHSLARIAQTPDR